MRIAIGILCLAPVLAACASSTEPDASGTWGGSDASLSLTAAGGTVQYPCGAGTIDPGWSVSADGTFAALGQHFMGGGPAPAGGRPPHPAAYTGRIHGDVFTLSVLVSDLDVTLGPYHLVRDGAPVAEICY